MPRTAEHSGRKRQKGEGLFNLLVPLAICAVAFAWVAFDRAERMKRVEDILRTPRVESAQEAAALDAAERHSPVAIPAGLWTSRIVEKRLFEEAEANISLLLRPDMTFVVSFAAKGDFETKHSASGTYAVRGSTVRFTTTEGPKGLLHGRYTFRSRHNSLVLDMPEGDIAFRAATTAASAHADAQTAH